jgi:hypothetical protein
MTRQPHTPLVTPRDFDLFWALDHAPLTARQLLKFSQTFAMPFTEERRVRERLHVLAAAGRVHRWHYATAGQGSLNYYTLSPLGFQLLHGPKAAPPTKGAFGAVGIARQFHTFSLAEFVVHTAVAAHQAGVRFASFSRENSVCLRVGQELLWPDCTFQLLTPAGQDLGFLVEIDNASERLRSTKDADSWESKIHLYDRYQDACGRRFRVLVVCTRSGERLEHILHLAARKQRNPNRSLFYGIALPNYLAQETPLSSPCFRDHRGAAVRLLPQFRGAARLPSSQAPVLASAAGVC